jgi:hypothetical protein
VKGLDVIIFLGHSFPSACFEPKPIRTRHRFGSLLRLFPVARKEYYETRRTS